MKYLFIVQGGSDHWRMDLDLRGRFGSATKRRLRVAVRRGNLCQLHDEAIWNVRNSHWTLLSGDLIGTCGRLQTQAGFGVCMHCVSQLRIHRRCSTSSGIWSLSGLSNVFVIIMV